MFNWINVLIPFALFCFIAVLLTRKRFSARITYAVWAAVIAAVSVTHIVLFCVDKGSTLLLSLMPVTAYLPVIVAFYALSKRNVVSNCLATLIALLCSVSVILLSDMTGALFVRGNIGGRNFGAGYTAVSFIVPFAASVGLGLAAYRFLRNVFARERVLENKTWYVLPAVFLLLLFSLYQKELLKQPLMIAFLLAMNVCVLALIVAFIVSKYKNADMEAERAAVERQLAAERARYGSLKTSLETAKRYRHDLRHHFRAIAALASEGDSLSVAEYVNNLGAKLTETEGQRYCANAVLNSLLSAFCQRAEEAGIKVVLEAAVPESPSADECDLCALVGNALDNAFNACEKITDGEKKIKAAIRCDEVKTVVEITNTAAQNVPLGKDGLPVRERTEEHGWGLSSISCIVKNYGGILKCESEGNTFTLAAVLFAKKEKSQAAPKRSKKQTTLYSIAALPVVVLIAILSVNCLPATLNALERVPVLGKAAEIIDFRNWGWSLGDSGIKIEKPITDDPDANEIISGYVRECREKFERYYASKYHGYVYSEFTSKEIVNDEELYVLRMSCLIQAGSSAEYLRYFTIDKRSGEIVSLPALFKEGSDWNSVLSDEIRRQMRAIVDADEGDFFGFGIWANSPDAFTRLDDPNFYIDAERSLTIVFDEQEVAPGNMGCPSFTIPYRVVRDILSENSLLKEGGQ